ncbi:MAG TPA: hypothetical protein VF455_10745 [Chryseobacterium sp.]
MKPAFGGKRREFLSKRNLCHSEKNLDNFCIDASSMANFENKLNLILIEEFLTQRLNIEITYFKEQRINQ